MDPSGYIVNNYFMLVSRMVLGYRDKRSGHFRNSTYPVEVDHIRHSLGIVPRIESLAAILSDDIHELS